MYRTSICAFSTMILGFWFAAAPVAAQAAIKEAGYLLKAQASKGALPPQGVVDILPSAGPLFTLSMSRTNYVGNGVSLGPLVLFKFGAVTEDKNFFIGFGDFLGHQHFGFYTGLNGGPRSGTFTLDIVQ